MIIYIILIGLLIFIGWMIMKQSSDPIENKQTVRTNGFDPLCYKEGDYGRYPFILYEKRDRERRLYDSLTYDFYRY